ncbi:MAG: hypothetical protein WEB63_02285 [Cucumibacter sp.]
MPKRRWLAVAAFGLVVSFHALAEDSQQQEGQAETQQQSAANTNDGGEYAASQGVPSVAQVMGEESTDQSENGDTQYESQYATGFWDWLSLGDTPAQAIMAWGGLVAAIAALFAAGLLGLTLRQTRISDERQTRAYVGISSASIKYEMKKGRFALHVIAMNNGQTPAYDVRLKAEWYDADHGPTDHSPPKGASRGTVNPSKEIQVQFNTDVADETEDVLTPEQCAAIFEAGTGIWLNGRIEYTDAFKKERFTNYRYKLYKRGTLYGLSATNEGNESN